MKKLNYSLAALALITLVACNKAEMPGFLSDPDAVRVEAAVGVLTKSNPLGSTIEEQMKFNDGDRIAVTNAGKTVVYKLNGGTWAPENSGEYLKWDKNYLEFIAQYPVGYTTLPTDQSTKEKLAAADRMYVNHPCSYIPPDRILSTSLQRKNVLVKVKIAGYLDQYKEGETYIKNLSFNKVQFPSVGCTYTAILEPHKGAEDEYFVEMIPHKANQEGDPLRVKGIPELKAGHAYTFELYVGKETVKVGSVTVKEWTTGVALPDGETDPVDTWDGQTVSAFATKDANGKDLGLDADNPILINSCAQLAYLSKQVAKCNNYTGHHFKLTDDLNLAGKSWSPIGYKYDGNADTPFCGTFDGAGHEIMGLKVEENHDYLGLFGYIKGATVKNLKISSADISSSSGDYGAILCGLAEDGAEISNCSVSGKVRIEYMNAGGLVAEFRNSTMTECTAEVEVTSQQYAGGLCGMLKCGEIKKCTVLPGSTMAVIPDNYTPNMGGLIGYIDSDGITSSTIRNCSTYAKVSGFGNVGGAIGYVDTYRSHLIAECTAYGDVSVSLPSGKANFGIGGFVGSLKYNSQKPSFSNCGFEGSIANADGTSLAKDSIYGAFIGLDESKATFTDCWYKAGKTGELEAVGTGVKDKDYTGIAEKKN